MSENRQIVKLSLEDDLLRKLNRKGYKDVMRYLRQCQNTLNIELNSGSFYWQAGQCYVV